MGSCLTLGNEFSEEIHVLTKQETLLGRGVLAESSRVREARRIALQGKGSQEDCSATWWFAVSGFMVMRLVSGFSLANPSDSGSFLVASALLSQDGLQAGGFWEVGRIYELASGLSF